MLQVILKFSIIIFCICVLFGCGGGGSSSKCGNFKVINGTECDREDVPTVMIEVFERTGVAICTGTVIGEDYVLTAAHCLVNSTGANIIHDKGSLAGDSYINNPLYDQTGRTSHFDIGLIKVKNIRSLLGIKKAKLNMQPVSAGDTLTFIGYGVDENGNFGNSLPSRNPRVADIKVSEVVPGVIITEFNTTQTNPCFGDSGGAAYKNNSIVGTVSSGTTENCKIGDINLLSSINTMGNFNFLKLYVPDVEVKD